jgi:predicted DNA-binding protein (MmcQ/YjbR family)
MNIEEIREYCLAKKGVTEEFPFDSDTLAFKVMNKVFLLTDVNWIAKTVNLKCDPEYAVELREQYEEVQPGYHMNKKHWNTVECEGRLGDKMIRELIDHSYELVVKGLTKKQQQELL